MSGQRSVADGATPVPMRLCGKVEPLRHPALMPAVAALAQTNPPQPRLASKDEYLACLRARSTLEARKDALASKVRSLQTRQAEFQAAEEEHRKGGSPP